MRYTVLIDGAEGAYGVTVPDFPGCVAMGATIDQALANAVAAMRDWAEMTAEDGGPVPAPRAPETLIEDPDVKQALAAGATLASLADPREGLRIIPPK